MGVSGEGAGSCTIAVDAMGSDKGPGEFVRGLLYAQNKLQLDCDFVLVGKERLLQRLLQVRKTQLDAARVRIHHAPDVIGMDEKPVQVLKKKKGASMLQAVELLRAGEVDAVVSCGNTGALMASGTLRLRPLQGVDRPALGIIIPGKSKPSVLIDVGANPESDSGNLVQNAILGANYAKAALGLKNPSVGLLTIGTEEGKGNSLINATHTKLQQVNGVINYVGPIEGFQVFDSVVDVIVCDGFVGNVLLKSSEAVFKFVGSTMKQELLRNLKRKVGAALSKSAFQDMRERLGPDQHAGAPLLGLNGNILKSHGSSNFVAIANALRIAGEVVRHDMIDSIRSDIGQSNALLQDQVAHASTLGRR